MLVNSSLLGYTQTKNKTYPNRVVVAVRLYFDGAISGAPALRNHEMSSLALFYRSTITISYTRSHLRVAEITTPTNLVSSDFLVRS